MPTLDGLNRQDAFHRAACVPYRFGPAAARSFAEVLAAVKVALAELPPDNLLTIG